jgi:hypothetical protein
MSRNTETFATVRVEGAILPVDLLQRVAAGDARLGGLRPEDYHLAGEKINEATNQAWNRLLPAWEAFKAAAEKLSPGDPGHALTLNKWLLPLWRTLEYGQLDPARPFAIDGKEYAISHVRYHSPIHLVGFRQDLDRRVETAGGKRPSPHGLEQEFLNRSEAHLWGFVSNGLKLRVLRDNIRLTRQAFVEFDLQAMFDGKVYSDFALLWRLCHESRVHADRPEQCWLEKWSKAAAEQGLRALDQLRGGVEDAVEALGRGFLHPANAALVQKLRSGTLQAMDYYRQLLRVVYRLLFLFVAEDREPLFRKALAIWEEVLGPKHPHTAAGYHDLAYSLHDLGKARDAEPLFRRALALREEVLGPKHPHTAETYNDLAANLQAQGKARDAEPLFRKALALFEEVLGPKHPHTALICNNLAVNLDDLRKARDAELLHRKALALREEVLGPKHPDTARSYSNLAVNLHDQGKARDAEPLFRKALAIWEEVLGPKHPDTARSYDVLAYNLDAQGKARDAEAYWRVAVEALEAARLRLASTGLDRAAATTFAPHPSLALSLARQGKAADAWRAAERGLARGLLDDLTAATLAPDTPDDLNRLRDRAARLEQLEKELLPLLRAEQLDAARLRQRDELTRQRANLQQEIAAEAAERAGREVVALESLQQRLLPEMALVFWVDISPGPGAADPGAFHYACILRRQGPPVWDRLPSRGPARAWTTEDNTLPGRLRQALAQRSPAAAALAQQLYAQRLEPLMPHLAATAELPAVTRLIAVPAGWMAGIPLESFTDRYAVSYVPSASVFVRQAANHRPLRDPILLALGDPAFAAPETKRPDPPMHGLLALQVLPGSNAARAGLRDNDVLLAYAGTDLRRLDDLQVRSDGGPIAARVWREGTTLPLKLAPGDLGVVFHKEPAPIALRQRQQLDNLLASTRGEPAKPLPGSRREVEALAGLFPRDRTTVLLGSEASEQRLDELAAAGRLKDVRLLHLATHGKIDPASAHHSALLLAADRLPDEAEQVKQNKKVYTGELKVQALATWKLDADLVTLSACETGLGQKTAGDGFLGFTHMLLKAGARSLVVSLWEVDDASTALLMTRFYENLLGKRKDLAGPLGRAEALRQAQRWLRELRRPEAEALAEQLNGGLLRGTMGPEKPVAPGARPVGQPGDRSFAHPYYWAAFILLGDPD